MLAQFSRVVPIVTRCVRPLSTPPPSSFDSIFAEEHSEMPDESILDRAPSSPPKPTAAVSSFGTPAAPALDIPPAEDPLLRYVASSIMHSGRRHRAARATARMLLHVHAFTRAAPLPIVREAVRLAGPSVRVVTMKQGGKAVMLPAALGEKARTRQALQWILQASDARSGKTIEERLAREVVAVVKGDSGVLAKKREVHRLAMVNRGNIRTV